jgi:hypothetical protein
MKELNIKIYHNKSEIYVKIGGNDYYYDLPCTETEAVIRSVMRFYGCNPDYILDGIGFEEDEDDE